MIRQAVAEVLDCEYASFGLDIEIGCENGETIALRTFNPRLGIEGGISILGTTGIVEPKSLASFKASIEVYIRVAVGNSAEEIVLSPGNLGQRFARARLNLPLKQIVQMSNFVGFALESLNQTLVESQRTLPLLWIVGHPGKLAKLLCGHWDTHSTQGLNAIDGLLKVAGFSAPELLPVLEKVRSTEAAIECLRVIPGSDKFWRGVENAIVKVVRDKVPSVEDIKARLFAMDGTALGGER
jgi:cobalt-precorrin-5B (C1)-methyltransferase